MDELEEARRAENRKILLDAVENNKETLRKALFIDLLKNDLKIKRWLNNFKQRRVRKKKIKQLWRVFISEWNLCSSERQ